MLLVATFSMATAAAGSASEASAEPFPKKPEISGSVEGYYFHRPKETDSALGIGSVEVGRAHLEARYNYEDLRTGSFFAGARLDVARGRFELSITPIVGMVVGRTSGVAPGLEIEAKLWKLELSSESEFVWSGADPDPSFVYSWNELAIRPVAWARAGLVGQRTRFVGERAIADHGFLVGLTFGPLDLGAYVFQPFESVRYFAFVLGVSR